MQDGSSNVSELLRTAVLREIERISEDEWCAGWMGDIEFMTYRDAQAGRHTYLLELIPQVDGWWVWDRVKGEERFVLWEEFLPLLADYEEKNRKAKERMDRDCERAGHKTDGFTARFHGTCMCGKVKAS